MNSGAAVDVFSQLKDSINAWISHLRNWSLREGKQWEIGKGRWIISSEWIIISCGVHSTVLSSPQGLSTAPLLPRNKPIQFSLLKENSLVGYVLQVTLVSPWLKKIISFIEPGNLGAERLTGVRILILIICMKVKGCERKLLRTASLEQNNGWPGLQLTAAYVVMTMGCTRVHSKIWKYNCDIRSVVSTQRSPISVCS